MAANVLFCRAVARSAAAAASRPRAAVSAHASLTAGARRGFAAESGAGGASAAPVKRGGSSIVQRVVAFSCGAAVASAFYYFQLHQDIWDSTVKIEKALSNLKLDSVQEHNHLKHRVAVLEKEMELLKRNF